MASASGEVPLKRSDSYKLIPPDMSELRLVLLGNSWSQRSSVGNILLKNTEFDPDTEPDHCLRLTEKIHDKDLTIINSPDLLHPDLPEHRLTELIAEISEACAPGPHVFLLVLQPEDFTEQHKTRLQSVLEKFSEQAFDHSLVLISPREDTPGHMETYMNHPHLQDIIIRCRYRYLNQKNLELPELLTRVGQIIKENSGEHLRNEPSQEEDTGLTLTLKRKTKPSLNLVLCGRREAEKTSAAESILGRTDLSPEQCVLHQGEVCGRWVSLVELPALSGEPLETVMHQCLSCVSLCGPEGVHAFILVLPVGPLTDEDKQELEVLQDTLSSRVSDFTIVLFTVESDSVSAVNFPKETCVDIKELCQSCGEGPLCLNIRDHQQVREMLDVVEKFAQKSFTKDMFIEAQMKKVLEQHKGLKTPETSMSLLGLRLVLIGKSGSGKSATANTILGQKHFKPRAAPKKANTSCEKACATVEERHVTVVNTPPLFDKSFSEEPLYHELSKSITMLSPGPHAFLLVLPIGNISPDEERSLELIKKVFGQKAADYTMIVFTKGDDLGPDQSVESYIEGCDFVKDLLNQCEGRYHVLNNKDETNRKQVSQLLSKIDKMLQKNCGFTQYVFESERKEEEMKIRHEREVKKLKTQIFECNAKFEQERVRRDRQLKKKEEILNQERKKDQEEEVKKWKRQEEAVKQEWKRKMEDAERRIRLEAEEKQRAEKRLEQSRKDMDRQRKEWEKERKEILENRYKELKQSHEVQSESYKQLQKEYYSKRKKWTYTRLCPCC